MKKEEFRFEYEVYDSLDALSDADADLLRSAREVTAKAYAPYSHFHVGAVAKFTNGETIAGTNQENASYPVGLCAERALLASAAMFQTNIPISSMAIAYENKNGESDHPVSPCGMCRQYIAEYETRMNNPIRLILSGMKGPVYIVSTASALLPLSFGSDDLK